MSVAFAPGYKGAMQKSISRDRPRISSQKHEIAYAGRKVSGGTPAVRRAKQALGRTTSRAKVMTRAGRS
jgi:hypothetical protein